jgi:hypothetical protein
MPLARFALFFLAVLTMAKGQMSAPLIRPQADEENLVQSKVNAALYVTGWEVTRELVLHPAVVAQELDLAWEENQPITAAMRADAAEKIVASLTDCCDVIIDSELAEFAPEGVQFIEPDIDNFLPLAEDQSALMDNFRIVVKSSTPLPSLESQIMLNWKLFPAEVTEIPLRIADTLGSRLRTLTPETGFFQPPIKLASNLRAAPEPPPAPEVKELSLWWLYPFIGVFAALRLWHNKKLAVIFCVLASVAVGLAVKGWNSRYAQRAGLVAQEEAEVITDRILEGVYHAFNFRDEDTQYDVLAQVLAEPALTETFLETNRTVKSRQREGSQVKVQSVVVTAAQPAPLPDKAGFAAKCEWRTRGQIGHWGHFHDRSNLFTADLKIEIQDGHWKATAFQLRNRERE